MILSAISKDIFNIQTFSQAAIVDSGFSQIPANATLHTQNTFIRRHGSQVLKILSFHNQDPSYLFSAVLTILSFPGRLNYFRS